MLLSRLPEFSPAELSCLINSLTKMAGPDPEADPDPDGLLPDAQLLPPSLVLTSLLAATEPVLASSSSRDLSCILNGLARLGHDPGADYMGRLADRAVQVAGSFTAQGLATSLNALARLPPGRAPPALVRCLGDRALGLLQRQLDATTAAAASQQDPAARGKTPDDALSFTPQVRRPPCPSQPARPLSGLLAFVVGQLAGWLAG